MSSSATMEAPPSRSTRARRAARLPAVEVRVETQGAVRPIEAGGQRLLDALRELSPDVVVLSRALPDAEAIRVLRALRAAGCRAAITFERRTGTRPRAVNGLRASACAISRLVAPLATSRATMHTRALSP